MKKLTQKRIKAYVAKAKNGDIDAQLTLGDYAPLQGNFKEACIWYLEAAKSGNVWAQHNLGYSFQQG